MLRARKRQAERFGTKGPAVNGRMNPRQIRKYCVLKPEAASLLKGAMEELGLSAPAHDKVLGGRTMADLEGTEDIEIVTWPRRWGSGLWIGACGPDRPRGKCRFPLLDCDANAGMIIP